jgi:2-succinyl-6-hydroxy-2,4-cyclohexadiene-1-carboxylate synthase
VLNVEAGGSGPPLVLVHGFTQTARSWGEVGRRLAQRHRVLAVDAPGHGGSAGVAVGLWEGADELVRSGGTADYLGYSMGGRLCLHAALAAPGRVQRLVLVGATAGIRDPVERAARGTADARLASSLVAAGDAGLPAFLERWLAGPLFATLPRGAADLESRLANTAAGLAASLTLMGTGAQEPLDERLGGLAMPVLCVVGEHDAKFRAEADRLAEALAGGATVAVIPKAGHACHLERPGPFVDAVEAWFTATAPGPG